MKLSRLQPEDEPAPPKSTQRASRLIFSAATVACLALFACDDGGPGAPGDREMSEAREVLTGDLSRAFETRDPAAYAELLHPQYRFSFAPGDAPSDLTGEFWGKRTEGAVIDSILASGAVSHVEIDAAVLAESMEPIAGSPGSWEYEAGAIVGAMVVTGPPGGAGDTAVAATAAIYRLRIDPADGAWKIYDETDQGTVAKRSAPGLETMRWGEMKASYYVPLDPPSTRTVMGRVVLSSAPETPLEGATVSAGTKTTTTDENGLFAIEGVPSTVASCTIFHPGALFSIFGIGGGDDVYRVDVSTIPSALQGTPAEAIELEFPLAYSSLDSLHYASLLDSRYTFELLPSVADTIDPNPSWDRSEELDIAGRMFKGREGQDGITVRWIDLALDLKSAPAVDDTPYPGRPPGETWYRATAFVDLLVMLDEPGTPGGIINFVVNSDQIFVMRPDPAHAGRFLVFKQTDQEPINKSGEVEGTNTEETSWGAVKSLFR